MHLDLCCVGRIGACGEMVGRDESVLDYLHVDGGLIRYNKGKPIMEDGEFEELRLKLKKAGSLAVKHEVEVPTQFRSTLSIFLTCKPSFLDLP